MFQIESQELTCQCGHVCYGVTELIKHDIDHKIESLKEEYRIVIGTIWDMTSDKGIRQYSLCNDSGLDIDWSLDWHQFQKSTKDKIIGDFICYGFYDELEGALSDKIKKIKIENGIIEALGHTVPFDVNNYRSVFCLPSSDRKNLQKLEELQTFQWHNRN